MMRLEQAWLAGLYEGEGSCYVGKAYGRRRAGLTLQMSMVDEDVIRRVRSVTGIGTVTIQRTGEGRQTLWRWQVRNRSTAADLARALQPWLGERRQQQIQTALDRLETE